MVSSGHAGDNVAGKGGAREVLISIMYILCILHHVYIYKYIYIYIYDYILW
jgi:hypothetical protein